MANRRLFLEYPAGYLTKSTHREVFIPADYYKTCEMDKKTGDNVTTNMWRAHIVGLGINSWPPTIEEFMEAAGYEWEDESEAAS